MFQEGNDQTLTTISKLTIPARFKGPPAIANGGYVCGLLAKYINGAAEVMIKFPTPLDRELTIRSNGDGAYYLMDGEKIIIQAKPADLDLETPKPPTYEEALAASKTSIALKPTPHPHMTGRGIHPICFCCGADVPEGQGLYIHPGRVDGVAILAAAWIPAEEYGDDDGNVRPEFIWTALDCPGAFALRELTDAKPGLSGRLVGKIEQPLKCGERSVITAWPVRIDGRKLYAGTALFGSRGQLIGRALATWFSMPAPNTADN